MSARRGADDGRGQALVEFAFVIPIFLLLFMAIVDLGTAVFSYNSLTNAAREGVRLAIVNQDKASIVERAEEQLVLGEVNAPNVTIGFYEAKSDGSPDTSRVCDPVAVGCLAVVGFETTYHPLTPIIAQVLFSGGVTFTAQSVLTVEYSCPTSTRTAAQCPRQP